MTKLQLGFGNSTLDFLIDPNRFEVLNGNTHVARPLTDQQIGETFDEPIESKTLEELFAPGDSVLLVVSDATRATASAQVLNLFVRRLIELGIAPADMAVIFATGIHRAVTPPERIELLTPFIAQRLRTIDHDAHDDSQMISFGTTERGTPVSLNRALKEFTHFVIISGINFHYFAGFTGGRKSICPGLAAAQTIESTHMLALDFAKGGRRTGVGTALLDGNAMHEECERIAALVAPTFSINSVVDERGRAVGVYAGDWRAAHRAACTDYLASHSVAIEGKRHVVIVSCGGSPYDLNLIQAHKAIDMAANACQEGGTMIVIAECSDGLGRDDFLKWFEEKDSTALAERLRNSYEVNGQTAWSLLTKAERCRIFLLSKLPDDQVRRMRMTPVSSLDELTEEVGGAERGYVMPHGARFLPVITSGQNA